jgi:hypothetical protein
MPKNNPYGYDSTRWVERGKRKTNWEPTKPPTEKGKKTAEKVEEGRRRLTYEERAEPVPGNLLYSAEEDYAEKKAKLKKGKASQREAQRRSDEELKKKAKEEKRKKRIKEEEEASADWRMKAPAFKARREKMFKIPGWAEWSKSKINRYLGGEDVEGED